MKNKIKYLLLLAPALLFAGCFDDKGNYDYTTINEVWVDTAGVQTSFTLGQFETLQITPNVKFSSGSGDTNDLAYRWVLYATEGDTFMEELSTQRDLSAVVSRDPGSYRASLYVTYDNGSQPALTSMMTYNVVVTKNIVSGIVVMHTGADGTDLDYLATPNTVPIMEKTKRLANLYSTVNGRKITGNPISLSTTGTYSNYNSAQRFDRIYVGTDTELVQVNGVDFSQQRDGSNIFLDEPDNVMLSAAANYAQYTVMVNDGKAYYNNSFWIMEMTGPLKAASTLTGPVTIAPVVYTSTTSASTSRSVAVLYDKTGKRFINIEYTTMPQPSLIPFAAQTSTVFDVNNIGMDILYLGKGFGGDGFAVFADGSDRWLYRMNFNIANLTTDTEVAKARYNMSSAPEIADAKLYANGQNGDVFLYATDRNIYTYSYASSQAATKINNDFPAGETITAMHLVTYRIIPSYYGSYSDVSGHILYVGTWNGTEGKLYEFQINRTSGLLENNREPLDTFTGFGRISGIALKEEADAVR